MSLKRRHKTWWFRQWIPADLRHHFDGRTHIERSLQTADEREAMRHDKLLAAQFAIKFDQLRKGTQANDPPALRAIYEQTFAEARHGGYQAFGFTEGPSERSEPVDPRLAGIDLEIDKIAEADPDLSPANEARLAGLQDASRALRGSRVKPRAEYEAAFSAVADEYMKQWLASAGMKATNTPQQKRATFTLFAAFWDDRPIRGMKEADAASFHDQLRLMHKDWARTGTDKALGWSQLVAKFGNQPKGLAPATMNRHMAALKSLWAWARKRGYCSGDNPFDGFRTKLKQGVNVNPYLPWENDELNKLLNPAPSRQDLLELMLVGMFSAMRIDEIASLTWERLGERDGIHYFQVADAKTIAGNRAVPVHRSLAWLLKRTRGKHNERIWPGWNPEGPGKKPGMDASRQFSYHKVRRGFTGRAKSFHSFRKNVTRMMEQGGVPENEWAQVLGHERGFTFGTYNTDGITMAQRAALIERISYPGVKLPTVLP